MRIRRRPPFSSPSLSSPTPSPLSDPSFNALPALLRSDATKDAAAHSTRELHQQGDLLIAVHHGAAQGPNRTAPRQQLPVHHLESQANAKGCSSSNSSTNYIKNNSSNGSSFWFPHPAGDGRVQVLSREELKIEEDAEDDDDEEQEEEEKSMVESNNKGCDEAKVNSNKNRTASGAGALILLEAAQRLEESAAALAKKEAIADDNGGAEDEKLKGKASSKARRRRPPSWSNGCTSDNEKHRVAAGAGAGAGGGATSEAVQAKDEDKLPVANGNGGNAAASNGKKRRSPAVLMEGSRCSRVNGRGWRCCQQTLVGYSLCEHHLGKGRLRSMSSVRGQIGATTRPKRNPAEGVDAKRAATSPTSPSSAPQEQEDKQQAQHLQHPQPAAAAFAGIDKLAAEEGEGGGGGGGNNNNNNKKKNEDSITRKKRKKMGMVKARSISSLLDGSGADPSAEPSEVAKVLPHETVV